MTVFDWMKDAKCTGKTALFFPPLGEKTQDRRHREKRAVIVCMSCPVMLECRDHARKNNELGVWGGETEDQRFRLGYLDDPFMRRKFREREKRKLKRELSSGLSVKSVLRSEDA